MDISLFDFMFTRLPNPGPRVLEDLAILYHVITEEYDRSICNLRSKDGTAMPMSSLQYRQMTVNALKVRKRLTDIAKRKGYTKEEYDNALQKTVHINVCHYLIENHEYIKPH